MFPLVPTRVRPDKSGAPYTVTSTSSPGPRTGAEEVLSLLVLCSESATTGPETTLDGSIVVPPRWVGPCVGSAFCAGATWSKPATTNTTIRFEKCEREFGLRCMTVLHFKPLVAHAQPKSREHARFFLAALVA